MQKHKQKESKWVKIDVRKEEKKHVTKSHVLH